VALALPISIRSDDSIPNDLLAIKEITLANPPPPLTVTTAQSLGTGGAILRGTVRLPSYLDAFYQIARDPVSGKPVATGSENVPFVLRLPPVASAGPAPIVMYQHGNPGSPEEIARDDLNGYLANSGFAVGGIRDYINRVLGGPDSQIQATFLFLLTSKAVPAFWSQTGADMIGFLRALQGLGGVAWRPPEAPQAPLLDTTRLFYHGISEGGNNALRFLPFAPELTAATPTVGGGRLVEILLHQYGTLLAQIEGFIPGVRPVQTLTGLSLFQAAYDAQDPHSFARFVNRSPLVFPSLPGARAPSILWTEGIGDTFVPNNATRSAARELGFPTMRKVRRASPVLTEVDGPLQANIAPDRTSAHFQYDPATTPGCFVGQEGHYCPQTSFAAQQQRLTFFQTALQGPAPVLVDPTP
jgi:poly(3-hydroxybutyrate) depolymerase